MTNIEVINYVSCSLTPSGRLGVHRNYGRGSWQFASQCPCINPPFDSKLQGLKDLSGSLQLCYKLLNKIK